MAKSILDVVLAWSKERPAWQRDALRRLFTSSGLRDSDILELFDICKAARGLVPAHPSTPLDASHIAIVENESQPVSLVALTHHKGVNALAPEQTVSFGPNLTVVYGENAAGKSGYTRILKQACRSRSVEGILGNVLAGTAPQAGHATIKFKEGAVEKSADWKADSTNPPALASISVFDSQCVPVYLRDKTDVAFRPFSLDVFDSLATAAAELKKKLDAEMSASSMPVVGLPVNLKAGTKARAMLDGLTALTKDADVQQLGTLLKADEGRLSELQAKLRDTQATDVKQRARDLNLKAARFKAIIDYLKSQADRFGQPRVSALETARARLVKARQTVSTLQSTAFTPDLLPGTGGPTWRAMWSAASAFAADSHIGFPAATAGATKCPLCQQDLDANTNHRMQHFKDFVSSTAQAELQAAERDYTTAWREITRDPISVPGGQPAQTELSGEGAELGTRLTSFIEAASGARGALAAVTEGSLPPAIGTFDLTLVDEIQVLVDGLTHRATELQSAPKALTLSEQKELDELEARVQLRASLPVILADIERRRRLGVYSQCIDDVNTYQITKMSSDLTKLLITDQLRARFKEELKRLEFRHLAVEIQSAGGAKGALFHKLVFSNAPGVRVTEVLSEGESRALSLAAFLTELSTAPTRSAIIFDDPVSSLDHTWRARIAGRLVAEAKERQVIVFTHDLLFLKMLLSEAEKESVAVVNQYIRREGQSGLCSSDLPWVALNIKARIGVLKNRWQAADAVFRKSGQSAYEPVGREIFALLREAWERGVTEVLLNDVVERYRPDIETKKVAKLHDITESECDMVDSAMSECSRWMYGHDAALADGAPFPDPDTLKARIAELETWVETIRKRRK